MKKYHIIRVSDEDFKSLVKAQAYLMSKLVKPVSLGKTIGIACRKLVKKH